MWIAELLDNSWSSNISAEMSAFEEETKGDAILLFYVFLRENAGYTKEEIIAVEQQLSKVWHLRISIMTLDNSPSMQEPTSRKL